MSPTRVFQTNLFQGGGVAAADSKLTAIMDGLDALNATIVVGNHYAYPVESVNVPCSVVGYPSRIDFDATMQRGADLWVIPVWYVVGKTGTADARDNLSSVMADAPGIKDTLDGGHAFGDVRVTGASVSEIAIGEVKYLAAQFDCEVIG